MTSDETKVTIVAWPSEPVAVAHRMADGESCDITISFADTPARVIVATDPKQAVAVDMRMQVKAAEPIPICVKLCEPICARSDYVIGINIFTIPFASFSIHGLTRFYNCQEKPPVAERICVGFDDLKAGMTFTEPLTLEGLTFEPLGSELRAATFGAPAGRIKLVYMLPGMRVIFPQPVEDVLLTLNNYASPDLTIDVFADTTLLNHFVVTINNTVQEVSLGQTGVTSLTITGGSAESGLVEICYCSVQN